MQKNILKTAFTFAAILAVSNAAQAAEEFNIGAAVNKNNLEIVPNYLTGIDMEPMPKGSTMGPTSIHLEADIHATKGETHGFAEKEWIPYLTVTYTLEKVGSNFKTTGQLFPMTAGDGPHYANSLEFGGEGQYKLTYHIEPPSKAGFIRHIDKASGVPAWWQGFDESWTFNYPIKKKAE